VREGIQKTRERVGINTNFLWKDRGYCRRLLQGDPEVQASVNENDPIIILKRLG
jgi:hypothetical protein